VEGVEGVLDSSTGKTLYNPRGDLETIEEMVGERRNIVIWRKTPSRSGAGLRATEQDQYSTRTPTFETVDSPDRTGGSGT
jgi:hypothetical protein